MRKLTLLSAAVCLAFSNLAAAQNPQEIVEKAIAAHGGAEKLARLNRVHSKVEGTMDALPGQPPMPFVGESWRMDGHSKMVVTIRVLGQRISVTDAVHGDTQWRQLDGVNQEISAAEAAQIQESRYVDRIAKLGFLQDSGLDLSALAETKVADKPAVGVLVKINGHKEVKLFFDKETSLLVKVENATLDLLSGKEVAQELVFSEYQDKDGVKQAMRSAIYRDGKKIMDGKVTLLEFVDKIDEKIFARP